MPVAVGRQAPPAGQSLIDSVTVDSDLWQGWYAVDNTPGQRAFNAAWDALTRITP